MDDSVVEFRPYHWQVVEDDDNLDINIWGLQEDNSDVRIVVKGFHPYIYLELPTTIKWSQSKLSLLSNYLDKRMKNSGPVKRIYEMKKKLYFCNKEVKSTGSIKDKLYPFLKLYFKTTKSINFLSNIFKNPVMVYGLGKHKYQIHEQNADPILKFTSCRKIDPGGWIVATGRLIDDEEKESICKVEIVSAWKHLAPLPNKETVIRPLIMSIDIEAYSSRFPAMPDASRREDAVFMISLVVGRQGESEENYKNYLLTLAPSDKTIKIKNTKVIQFTKEGKMLEGFSKLVREINPDIIVGYNILDFDMKYLIKRSEKTLSWFGFSLIGKIRGKRAIIKETKWESSAYGLQHFLYLDIQGRLIIDMYPIIKREYKFSSYKLGNVSNQFLGKTKDPVTPEDIADAYKNFTKSALQRVGKYCVQDSYLPLRLMEHLSTWIGLLEMSVVTKVPIIYLYTKGQQIKVFSQIYRLAMYKNYVIQYSPYKDKDIEKYVGATVFDPEPGFYKGVVTFDFASLYPTIMIAYNIDYTTLVPEDSNIPDEMCNIISFEDHIACKHDPKLYAHCSKCQKEMYAPSGKCCPVCRTHIRRKPLVKRKKEDIICAKRRYRWLKEPEGLVPSLLRSLLEARKKVKGKIKDITKKLAEYEMNKIKMSEKKVKKLQTRLIVLDKQQLSIKISCNSAYGALGAAQGYLPLVPGAMCVTAKGRMSVQAAAEYVGKKYKGKLIYGDSIVGDEPILIHYPDNKIDAIEIRRLASEWIEYQEFKCFDSNRREKQQSIIDNLQVWSSQGWTNIVRVIRHKVNKKIYRVVTGCGCVDVTEDHSLLDWEGKIVKPAELEVGITKLLHSFPLLDDYYIGKTSRNHSKIDSLKIYCQQRKNMVYDDSIYTVRSVTFLREAKDEFVYDIETETGNFQAGVGELIVKNTDSVMIQFPNAKTMEECYKMGLKVSKKVENLFPHPMKLEFENVYYYFFILTKKRYAAYALAQETMKLKDKMTTKGIVLTRRDNTPMLKDVYGEVLDMIMHRNPFRDVINYVSDYCLKVMTRQIDYKKLILSKSINSDYKAEWCAKVSKHLNIRGVDEDNLKKVKNGYHVRFNIETEECPVCKSEAKTPPAHVMLAHKLKRRGNQIQAGDRIDYLFLITNDGSTRQGDKAENPDYYKDWCNILRLDYLYYLEKQLVKPLDEMIYVAYGKDNVMKTIFNYHKSKWKLNQRFLDLIRPEIIFDDKDGEDEDEERNRRLNLRKKKFKQLNKKKCCLIYEDEIVSDEESDSESDSEKSDEEDSE
jgi:DNA polymerase elongation subunit (family B)